MTGQLPRIQDQRVPIRTITWTGTSFADIAPDMAQRMAGLMHMTGEPDDRNAPTTSSIDCPANIPPELNVRLAMVWAKFAPAMSNMFVTTKVAAGVVD